MVTPVTITPSGAVKVSGSDEGVEVLEAGPFEAEVPAVEEVAWLGEEVGFKVFPEESLVESEAELVEAVAKEVPLEGEEGIDA